MAKSGRGGPPDQVQAEAAQAWQAACELYRHLASGGELVPRPSMMILQEGEVPYAELMLTFSRYFSTDVRAQQSSGFYFGSPAFVAAGMIGNAVSNSNARARAEQMGVAQWRYNVPTAVAITNRRVLTMFEGQWIQFPYANVMSFFAEPTQYAFVLTFGDAGPLRLTGPWAPWASLMTAAFIYGRERVAHLPAFQIFRDQVTDVVSIQGEQPRAIERPDGRP
ncbi:MAG: hypothetical protein GEV10_12400 [Streptosporangiales bacterium]|nr:hypothetical protein [Streptosporangiales bacterium]